MDKASNDVDALARVLAEHQIEGRGMTGTSPDTCTCGERVIPGSAVADEDISQRRARAFARHQAQAASGVVVSARDVKQLADDLRESEDLYTAARQFQIAAAVGSCRAQAEALLREPEGRCISPDGHEVTEEFQWGQRVPERIWCSRCGKPWAIVPVDAEEQA